ncbi:hypothetical protein TNIN_149481 [Trichonephila inaurata madagascariensis]|uniref:Uncharacterized protein n=1 Tax=Trichonephila inaurata madagascariensis TaxID=2747483 RepID=A0A8X6YLA1_9ARAC|nr:hypothetical protein TNIN_149481 [Trichonephila inaurata madagascariensis]
MVKNKGAECYPHATGSLLPRVSRSVLIVGQHSSLSAGRKLFSLLVWDCINLLGTFIPMQSDHVSRKQKQHSPVNITLPIGDIQHGSNVVRVIDVSLLNVLCIIR